MKISSWIKIKDRKSGLITPKAEDNGRHDGSGKNIC